MARPGVATGFTRTVGGWSVPAIGPAAKVAQFARRLSAGVLSGSSSASVLGEFFVFFDDGVAHVGQVRNLRQRVY